MATTRPERRRVLRARALDPRLLQRVTRHGELYGVLGWTDRRTGYGAVPTWWRMDMPHAYPGHAHDLHGDERRSIHPYNQYANARNDARPAHTWAS